MLAPSRTVYFENSVGRIWAEPAGYLRLDYQPGRRDADAFRALLTHLRQALSHYHLNRALINQREMVPFSASEEKWMVSEWIPLAVRENGYRYGAILMAQDVFARLAMSSIAMATHGMGNEYHNFADENEAVAWLLAQQ